ncbi:C4-dicarboxylate transporter DctA [Salmonella enterica subsp. enterica]|uniref:C4-dicarboxylate transporter DctA n=1 Tax=Salmonella enterica I TaxID=59201 RepID=A0A3S4LQL9_SALET|nr:C4-dicarboxylate transporter DctA [Salmonella enterica subsp. enterica]
MPQQAKEQGIIAFLMDVIPGSVIGAFASGKHSAGLTVCGVVWFCAAPFGQQRPAHFQCD